MAQCKHTCLPPPRSAVQSISLYFCLQSNKYVSYTANANNNNNFEMIRVINDFETVYVCTKYYLTGTLSTVSKAPCGSGDVE